MSADFDTSAGLQQDGQEWMSPYRRLLVAHVLEWLREMYLDREWWRNEAGGLLCYQGQGEEESAALASAAAGHFMRFGAMFDIALDALNDATNEALSDVAAREMTRILHADRMIEFDAEGLALVRRIADWRTRVLCRN